MIPDEVRKAIERLDDDIEYDVRLGGSLGSILRPWRVLKNWLDGQLQAPEPDWSRAPEWAQAHVYNCHGSGLWVDTADLEINMGSTSGWRCAAQGTNADFSGYRLPIGIDWRTTLRKRPEPQS